MLVLLRGEMLFTQAGVSQACWLIMFSKWFTLLKGSLQQPALLKPSQCNTKKDFFNATHLSFCCSWPKRQVQKVANRQLQWHSPCLLVNFWPSCITHHYSGTIYLLSPTPYSIASFNSALKTHLLSSRLSMPYSCACACVKTHLFSARLWMPCLCACVCGCVCVCVLLVVWFSFVSLFRSFTLSLVDKCLCTWQIVFVVV